MSYCTICNEDGHHAADHADAYLQPLHCDKCGGDHTTPTHELMTAPKAESRPTAELHPRSDRRALMLEMEELNSRARREKLSAFLRSLPNMAMCNAVLVGSRRLGVEGSDIDLVGTVAPRHRMWVEHDWVRPGTTSTCPCHLAFTLAVPYEGQHVSMKILPQEEYHEMLTAYSRAEKIVNRMWFSILARSLRHSPARDKWDIYRMLGIPTRTKKCPPARVTGGAL